MEKRPFFRAATAGLGKYHTGGYGRIGVYRVYRQIVTNVGPLTLLVCRASRPPNPLHMDPRPTPELRTVVGKVSAEKT